MAIFLRQKHNIIPDHYGSSADIQYAIRANGEKIYGINPDNYGLVITPFWGAPLTDYSGNKNHGVFVNQTWWYRGLNADGVNDSVHFDWTKLNINSYPFSILIKCVHPALGSTSNSVVFSDLSAEKNSFSCSLRPTNNASASAYSAAGGYQEALSTNTVVAGGKASIAGIFSASDSRTVYLNGKGKGTSSVDSPVNLGNLDTVDLFKLDRSIGADAWYAAKHFEYCVILKNTELTDAQVSLFYELPYGLYQRISRPLYSFLYAGDSLTATLPMISAEILSAGGITATLPMISAELLGAGNITATLPMISAELTGHASESSFSATLPAITAEIKGASGGFLEATLPAITADIKSGGQLEVTLPAITASLEGDVQIAGDLIVSLPAITASLEGKVNVHGNLICILPAITAELTGTMEVGGDLVCTLPMITAELTGFQDISGELIATLPAITAYLIGATDRFADCDVLRYEEPTL